MLTISPGLAGLIAVTCVPVTLALVVVTLLLLRDLRRADRQALKREGEVEHLRDEVWQARESEERYRSLVEEQNDLILRRDRDSRIVYANMAFLEMMGLGEDVVGRRFALIPSRSSEALVTAAGARSFDQEIETACGLRWLSWIESEVRGPEGAVLTQLVGRDITEKRNALDAVARAQQRAETANQAKSRFLATVSHELRTPLSGIMGMAGLLRDTELTAEQTTYARAIESSGESLLSLIDEILDFSKIESGKLELSSEPFDLVALVEGVVELLAPRAQDKGIEIASLIAPKTPRQVSSDPARLRQILVNLAGNAIKFTSRGGVGLSVSVLGEGRVAFKVSDTGEGIAPDRLQRIFDEFEQGGGTEGGAGLGLAISRRLAEMMGGSLSVESVPGRGSTFTAEIPLEAALPQAAPARQFPPDSRALIVARSPFEAPFLSEKLRHLGFEVDQVIDASDALALLASSAPPQLLIVDAAIGEAGARAVAARAIKAGTSSRLILLSPFERRQFRAPGAFGFDGYLVKPIRERSLQARLLEPGRREPTTGTRSERPPVRPNQARLRVLLAEDDDVNALLATRLLEKSGAEVEHYRDGQGALEAAIAAAEGNRPAFDVALLDIRMPGLDGNELARKLREAEGNLASARLKLVALSANAFAEDEAASLAAGFDLFLVKPMRHEDLTRVLAADTVPSKVA